MRNCPMIGEDENNLMMAPCEQQEILENIKACAGDKTPGLDGRLNATFVALIPKKIGAMEFKTSDLEYDRRDDTLVFCEEVRGNMLIMRVIFIIFEAISGLHINWGKSLIYPINYM
ncbi:hypothetical protein H5410_042388 [Solanum commersonii]|uniref:Uncharacterized protein n=1 Tax=Solanum commersonii TaxID=4109 RepID=A0A9J5XVW0_SOLCO|nr:hypothetical protein H5410_042388 [Solanum commersonii]